MVFELPRNLITSSPAECAPKVRRIIGFDDVGGCFVRISRGRSAHQYASTYYARLKYLGDIVRESAIRKWGLECDIKSLAEVTRDLNLLRDDKVCGIIGILHKRMKLKPCILDRYTKALEVKFAGGKSVSDDDISFLETSDGRIELDWSNTSGNIHLHELPTGIILAIKGIFHDGLLKVIDYALPGDNFSVEKLPRWSTVNLEANTNAEGYIAIVSNLKIAEVTDFNRLLLLKDLIGGNPSISRLIIAGNSIGKLQESGNPIGTTRNELKYQTADVDDNATLALEEFDKFVSILTAIVPVSIIPGADDPTTFALPQLPLPPRLFKYSKGRLAFQSLSNPSLVDLMVDNSDVSRRLMISSSQPIDDLLRYTALEEPIDCLNMSIKAFVIAPTCPDTLSCVPFDNNDYMCLPTPGVPPISNHRSITNEELDQTMEENHFLEYNTALTMLPDLFISGGHNKSSSSTLQTTNNDDTKRIISLCVADYIDTGDVILYNPFDHKIAGLIRLD